MDRRWRCARWILGSAALVAAAASHALGLGDAQLLSHLNEPLEVRIPLRLAPGERLDQTRVMLASEQAFTMLNMPQTPLAYQLRFEVVQGPSPYILIRAPTVVQDPIVQFPIQVTSEEGSSFIRGYTLFLKGKGLDEGAASVGGMAGKEKIAPLPIRSSMEQDEQGGREQGKPLGSQGVALPPRAKNPSAPADQSLQQAARQGAGHKEAGPARQEAWPDASLPPPIRTTALSQPQQEKRAPPAAPHATARESIHQGPSAVQRQDSKQTAAGGLPDRYGPVRPGETLFQVARAIQPHFDDISAARLAAALYQKNPRAFHRGAPGLLMKDSYLRIPDKHEVAAIQPAQASAILRGRYAAAQNRATENPTTTVAAHGQTAAQSPPTVRYGTETAQNDDSGAEESATQGRSFAPVNLTPSGKTGHVAETRSQPVAGSEQQTPAAASSASSTGAAPQAPVEASAQMGQPEVLLAQRPGSSTGSSMPTAPDPGSTGHESPQQSGGTGDAGSSAAPESPAPAALPADHQSQRVKAPVVPPPAQHQEGLRGQRSQVPWFVKLAVGIVGIACVLVGLFVFLSRRQRSGGQRAEGAERADGVPMVQASRDRTKSLPGLDAADSDPGSAQAMQQASELMACGLYQDAQTILEKALAADGGNQRLRLKYLEATAALGQFDKVSEQARLMAGFELEPQVRAAVDRLMQALPQALSQPDFSTPLSQNQDHEQEFAPGNQPADPVILRKPAASATDTWSASGLTQPDQGSVAPEQDGSPGVSVSTGKDAVADDSDFARWLMEKPDDPLLGGPSGNTGLQSVMSPDETTHESHAAGTGHVDWGFSGIQEAPPGDEEPEQKPAWAAPEQASLGQWDPGTGTGPSSRENDQDIDHFDWPAPSGQNQTGLQTALMDEARHAASAVEPAGLHDPGALSDEGFQEKHAPTPLPMDQRSTTVHAPDRPSVLAKPWEQRPALAEHASASPALPSFNAPQPGASEMSMDEREPQGDSRWEPVAPSPRGSEPSAATIDWQPPISSTPDHGGDFSMVMPAESTTQPMPSHEWPSPSASSMDQPDTREQSSGHDAVMHEMAGVLADSASSQDPGHEQEQQIWETQGNRSQPNQDILEWTANPSEGGWVMEWSAPQDQRLQAPGEEHQQVADSGLRLEQAWEERHDALPLPSTEPTGWKNENVGPALAHDERKPQDDLLLEVAQTSHPAQDVSAHEAVSWPDELAQDASPHAVVDDLPPERPAAVPGTEPSADGWLEPALGHAPGSLQQTDEPPQPSGVSDQATQTLEKAGETQAIPKGRGDDAEGSRLFERITRLARHREYT